MLKNVIWSQMIAPYSIIDRTSAMKAVFLHSLGQCCKFLLRKPKVELAFLVTLLMCSFHLRSSCHINDLPKAVSSKVRLFADDCLLNREINNEIDQNTLLKDIQNLEKWAINWGMRFNAKKCYMLSLRKKIQGSYKLSDSVVNSFLGSPRWNWLF
jgi:hypothetical protein